MHKEQQLWWILENNSNMSEERTIAMVDLGNNSNMSEERTIAIVGVERKSL